MLKKSITFNDLDGNEVIKDFYFNLSKAELAEMEIGEQGGLAKKLQGILDSGDQRLIVDTFKMILASAVGIRSEDGIRFIKNQDITDSFMQSEAYSELFMELITDSGAAAEFIVGVVPKGMGEAALAKFNETKIVELPQPDIIGSYGETAPALTTVIPPKPKSIEEYTKAELIDMPYEEFQQLVSHDVGNLPKDILVLAMQRRTSEK